MKHTANMSDRFKHKGMIFLLFFAISIFMFRRVVFKGQLFGDNVEAGVFRSSFHIATYFLDSLSFLWNPYFFCGFPLYADVDYFNLTSPFTILALSLRYFFGLSILASFNFISLFYYPLASFFVYLYASSIGIGRLGAIMSGIIFSFNIINDLPADSPEVNTLIWSALILFFFEKAVSQKAVYWRYVILAGVFYGIQFLGGDIQRFYYFSILLIFYCFFRYFLRPKEDRPKAYFLACIIILIIMVGVSAIQLLPTYELAKQSARFYFRDYAASVADGCLDKLSLKGIILLDRENMHAYLGVIPIFLALLPLFLKRRSKFYFFYLFTAALFLVMSSNNFIAYFLYHFLPYFAFFKNFLQAHYLFIFSISILSGWGLERVRPRMPRLILIAVVLISLNYLWTEFGCEAEDEAESHPPQVVDYSLLPDEAGNRSLGVNKFFSKFGDVNMYRVHLNMDDDDSFTLRKGLYSASGMSNLILSRALEFTMASVDDMDRLGESISFNYLFHPNYLRVTNTKYILMEKLPPDDGEDGAGEHQAIAQKARAYISDNDLFEKVYEDSIFEGYRFKDPLPRVIFVNQALCLKDRREILGLLKQPSFNPKTTLILEDPLPNLSLSSSEPLGAYPLIVDYLPSEVMVKLTTNSSGFLVLFDTYYPGWKALVDNIPAKIYRADYLFRAVHVDKPGVHTISFIYSPLSFKLGAAITITTLICSIGSIFWIGKRQ